MSSRLSKKAPQAWWRHSTASIWWASNACFRSCFFSVHWNAQPLWKQGNACPSRVLLWDFIWLFNAWLWLKVFWQVGHLNTSPLGASSSWCPCTLVRCRRRELRSTALYSHRWQRCSFCPVSLSMWMRSLLLLVKKCLQVGHCRLGSGKWIRMCSIKWERVLKQRLHSEQMWVRNMCSVPSATERSAERCHRSNLGLQLF